MESAFSHEAIYEPLCVINISHHVFLKISVKQVFILMWKRICCHYRNNFAHPIVDSFPQIKGIQSMYSHGNTLSKSKKEAQIASRKQFHMIKCPGKTEKKGECCCPGMNIGIST